MKHKMGVIGFGGMAGWHYTVMEKYDRCEMKGVFDLDPRAMERAAEKGLYCYKSKEELLSDPEIDSVLVATTNDAHKSLVIEAMAAGKNVICEKPVTITSAELEEIMEAEKKYGKVFTIDQNRRVNHDFLLMKNTVEKGLLGDVYVIESRVEGSRGMPSGWRTLKDLGGGMMLDWGVHLIDQLMYMYSDQKVTNVFCKMYRIQYPEVDDNFHLTMMFENGVTAHIEVATNNYITHPRWYVLGKTGTLQIDDWGNTGKVVRCIDKEDKWAEEIVYTKAGPTKTMAPRNENSTETIMLEEKFDVPDDMRVVYDQFYDAVEGKADLTITSSQALRVMKVMEAAFRSDEKGTAEQVYI